jgi:hypothetical protein
MALAVPHCDVVFADASAEKLTPVLQDSMTYSAICVAANVAHPDDCRFEFGRLLRLTAQARPRRKQRPGDVASTKGMNQLIPFFKQGVFRSMQALELA